MSAPDESVTGPGARAALAQLVGKALAHAHTDSGSEDVAQVKAITDAMVRLLIGAPLRSDGKLTIVSLAAEAGLRRNKLTDKHTGLKDLFYALVNRTIAGQIRPPRPRWHACASRPRTWRASAPNVTTCAS